MHTTMRKLILTCAIVILAAGGSALAQKPIVIIGPPAPFDQTISIQDDTNASFLVFETGSGKYTFTRCSDGFTLSGVGLVKVDGCAVNLADTQPGHRVAASVQECDQTAKAVVETFAVKTAIRTPFKVFLSDKNLGDNLMDCLPAAITH